MRKIRKGDEVIILAGKDKGKRGKVLRVLVKARRVYVEGVNMITQHVKPRPQQNQPGGRVEKEAAVHLSNVAIFNPIAGKQDRIKVKVLEEGRRVRCFKSNGELVNV